MSVFSHYEMYRQFRVCDAEAGQGDRCSNDRLIAVSVYIMIGGDYAGEVRSVDQLGGIR